MADIYAVSILKVYVEFLLALADSVFGILNYDQFVRCLNSIRQYSIGEELVHQICSEWIVKYPTLKVIVRELSDLM